MNRFRLLPLMAFAALCLFGLKFAGLLLGGGYTLSGVGPASAQNSKEKTAEAAGAEAPGRADDAGNTIEPGQPAAEKPAGAADANDANSAVTGSELAVLKSLARRRTTLEEREREVELRENLLQAAEKRIEARIGELKAIEDRIETELTSQDAERDAQFGRLVKVYSSMKPKSAAKIFNRLDINVLLGLVKRMRARSMSAILAAMEPAAAQRLTLELATQSKVEQTAAAALPKIKGRSSQ